MLSFFYANCRGHQCALSSASKSNRCLILHFATDQSLSTGIGPFHTATFFSGSRIEKTAAMQGVSMNQFAIYAFTREIGELETAAFFQDQYAGKSKKEILDAFDAVMKKIPKRSAPAWDKLEP